MFHIDASQLDHRQLNERIQHSSGTLLITGCLGQRFIGAGAEQVVTKGRGFWRSRGRRGTRWAPIWTAPASRCAATRRTPSAIR